MSIPLNANIILYVHQSEDKALAVVAVMVNEGEANPALAPVVEKKLTVVQKEKLAQPLDIQALMPKDRSLLHLVVKTWLGPFLKHQFKQAKHKLPQ